MNLSSVCLAFIVVTTLHRPQGCDGDYWDGVPVISQIKSLVQAIRGDANSAMATQENFLDQSLVVSQIKSIVQAARGDGQGAVDTRTKFSRDKQPAVDGGLPLSGVMYGVPAVVFGSAARVYGREESATKNSVGSADYVFTGNRRITRYRGGNYEKAAVRVTSNNRAGRPRQVAVGRDGIRIDRNSVKNYRNSC